ncbi:MAG: sigma-70 family RNA polymerase sigma factor [Pseudomonadota bacterium]
MTLDDKALLSQIAGGDRAAFDALYRRHYPRLFRFILRLTSRHDMVEEILNDTMLAVWRQAVGFEYRSRVSTWMLGIAYRQTMKRLDRSEREPRTVSVEEVEVPDVERLDRQVEAKERQRRLLKALSRLPATQRVVVELTLFHGLSYREIATLVDCPEGTVKTRMFHAREQLKKRLAPSRPAPNPQPSNEIGR